ncbi:MAG TPA: hypothetical protein VI037_10430 [Nitrososphaera sp.]
MGLFPRRMLFVLSGYYENIGICNLIQDQPLINTFREFWVYAVYAITPLCFLALMARVGGLTMLMETIRLVANRINKRKLLVRVGTSYELLNDMFYIAHEFCIGGF